MTALKNIRNLGTCTIAAAALWAAAPAAACETGNCDTRTPMMTDSEPQAASEPLALKKHMRKPVASSATRTVKKKNGEYAKVAAKRRVKQREAAAPPTPPAAISPAAAQAFAAYELARVRVVTPEEIVTANLLADAAAMSTASLSSNPTTIVGVDSVQVVSAEEVNDIDRKADSPKAVSLDALSRDLAGNAEPKAEDDGWLQRMLMVLGSAFAAAAALVRTLLG